MALSQLQCLDDNHVNPRTHESKPDFFYCEDQRLALEALMRDGREAFLKYLEARGLRGFLSDPELETLIGAIEPYDPGSELFSEDVEDEQTPLSLHYWPELSDTSIPQMDLGWPDSGSYRGVTRTTVYTQPPLDGHAHIKEVVRKMIAQAQKVIAVVMDVFTDVDIFRDLLDAGFKRRVSVYVLLESTTLPHFLAMCQRANMHAGHLKHLRVRCTGGAEFYTRSCTKVRGRMGHKFMFIDGDKAVSGSYSFTWMASRLDRNLITVVTGQAVDGFDQLFRLLYVTSSSVDLRQIVTEPEPEPEPLPQPATVAPLSAAVARKLYNPKYALVALTNPSPTPTPVNQESPKEPQNPENSKKKRRGKASNEAIQEAPPLHPGLTNLEKACLIAYLPTWPEPDPPSDVIGFINIRDANKPTQVHLQRSERFETSQAIRFSSPFSKVKETQPEVANPTQLTPKQEEVNTLQPAQDKSKADEVTVKAQEAQLSDVKSKEEASEQKSPASGQTSDLDTDTANSVSVGNKYDSDTATNPNTGLDTAPVSAHELPQSSSNTSAPKEGKTSHKAQPVSTNSHAESDSLPNLNTEKEAVPASSLNTQSYVVYRADTPMLNGTHASQLPDSPELNTEQDTKEKTAPSHADSHTQAVHKQPQISTEVASNIQTPPIHSNISTSPVSATQSKNNHIPVTTVHSSTSTSASVPSTSSSSLPPLTSSFTTLNPPLPASSSLTPAPPVPKPRTVHLVISDSNIGNGQKLPEICLVKKPKASTGQLLAHSALDVATVEQTFLVKECQTIPELQDDSASKTGAQKDTENTGNHKETPKQASESQETSMEADGRADDGAGSQMVTGNQLQAESDVLINDAPKAASLEIPKDVDLKISKDCRITEKMDIDCVAAIQADTTGPERTLTGSEFDDVPNQQDENVTKCRTFLAKAHEPQKISYSKLTPQDMGQLEALKAPVFCTSSRLHVSGDGGHTSAADMRSQQDKQAKFTREDCTDSMLNTTKHNTHGTFQEQIPTARVGTHTPEKALRLHLTETHLPDFRSQTPECKSQLLTPTLDSPSHASDFRTPTSDVCDGYISSREDSTLSATSDEYYECSDLPFNEPVFDHMAYCNHDTIDDHVSFTHTNILNAPATGISPAYINYSSGDPALGSKHSETQTLTGPSRVSSSSLLGKKVKMREVENTTNEENGSEGDKHGRKLSGAERREEQESLRRGSEETNRIVDCFKRDADSPETGGKGREVQAPARKVTLSQSAADRLVDGGTTAGESTKKRKKTKQSSTGDLKPATVSSEGGRLDKESSGMEKASNQVEIRHRGTDRRESPQSSRKTEGQKLSHSPPKPQRVQQRSGSSSPSRPPVSPQNTLDMQSLGPLPWGKCQRNQTESKVLQHSQNFSDTMSSPHKPPTTPPQLGAAGPMGFVAGWKQVSHSQQTQAPAAQTASAQEAHGQEGMNPFGFTLSRLYNLKGMKGKVNKTAAQSKRGSVTAPVQERNSAS
ncbi:flocculation protein FLO11-like isoform X2 [Archocentrus centrarchus]|uniref:flocculation protein FLO11-like isoform X2 n=1 Tax=Archocentrus centrarchus TaxID=63155 RepID=UPI0011E9CF67|nr:flocculation protein FLO11-like isoform X2 [Archocentrus centrarchus]